MTVLPSHEFAGALPVPFGHARPLTAAPRPAAADVPLADVERQLATHTTTAEEAKQ